jgi:SAM-dependent methyltransferase
VPPKCMRNSLSPPCFSRGATRLTAAAEIRPGQRFLDVACGTGVLACSMAERVGPTGSVVGVDVNEGMLAVAKRKAPTIEWHEVRAEALPFAENSFDGYLTSGLSSASVRSHNLGCREEDRQDTANGIVARTSNAPARLMITTS